MVENWFLNGEEHSNKTLTCAYWNITEQKWKTNGVSLIERNKTHTGQGFFDITFECNLLYNILVKLSW